jgi:hypothetical protein
LCHFYFHLGAFETNGSKNVPVNSAISVCQSFRMTSRELLNFFLWNVVLSFLKCIDTFRFCLKSENNNGCVICRPTCASAWNFCVSCEMSTATKHAASKYTYVEKYETHAPCPTHSLRRPSGYRNVWTLSARPPVIEMSELSAHTLRLSKCLNFLRTPYGYRNVWTFCARPTVIEMPELSAQVLRLSTFLNFLRRSCGYRVVWTEVSKRASIFTFFPNLFGFEYNFFILLALS